MSRLLPRWSNVKTVRDWEEAEASFRRLGDYQDANEKQELCKQKHDEALRKKKILNIAIICAAILIFTFIIVDYTLSFASPHYNQGEEAFASGDYSNAEKHYSVGEFRDAAEKQALSISIQHYINAENAFSSEDYQEAIRGYAFSGGYLDANAKSISHIMRQEKTSC